MTPPSGTTDIGPSLYPRTYRIGIGWRIFIYLFGFGFLGLGLFLGWKYFYDPGRDAAAFAGFSILSLAVAFYIIADTSLSKVVIYADAIEMYDIRPVRRLERAEIKGRMLIQTGQAGGDSIMFIPIDSTRKKMRLPLIVKTDDIFQQWINTLPDLDRAEREESEKEVLQGLGEGATPEEGQAALASAKKIGKIFTGIAWVACIGGFFLPPSPPLVAFLAALPWLALALAGRSPGLYALNDSRNDVRGGIATALMMPGIFLILNTLLSYHLLDWTPIHAGAVAIALLMTALAAQADKKLIKQKTIFIIFPLLIPYGYGTIVTGNAMLDTAPPKVFETTVISKHYTSGKGAHGELNLAPWGPDPGGDVAVTGTVYKSVSTGGKACVYLGGGGFGFPWYYVDRCH